MKSSTRTILATFLGLLYGFGSDFVAYLSGIKDNGGTLADIDGISMAQMFGSAVVAALGALMLLLAEPPENRKLVNMMPESKLNMPADIDLSYSHYDDNNNT